MLPSEIPLFPLPNVVLFPAAFLPLHIFEPRYRALIADALTGERLIGMVLLRPGWESDDERRPAVYRVGCAGFITHAERLDDGRYNVMLRGMEKFRIVDEIPPGRPDKNDKNEKNDKNDKNDERLYRVARVETIAELSSAADLAAIRHERLRLEKLIARRLQRPADERTIPPDMRDEDVVSALAQHLALDPLEKQALLEREGLLARCRSLVELIEMQMLLTHAAVKMTLH